MEKIWLQNETKKDGRNPGTKSFSRGPTDTKRWVKT